MTEANIKESVAQNDNLEVFIGNNNEYYLQKWQLTPGQLSGFNVAAFFLGVVWLIYRKMYWYAAIFLALIGLDMWVESYYPLPDAMGTAVNIAIATTFGILGNSLYKKHATETVQKIVNIASGDNLQADLTRAGGTNLAGACVFLIIILAIFAYAIYVILQTSH